MARRGSFPTQEQPDVKPAEMAQLVADVESLRQKDIPKTTEALEQRLQWFFQWCVEHQRRPTVELMSLACGVTRQCLWKWEQAGGERGEIISRAKQTLAALLETWMIEGRINPVSAIFLLKNHHKYSDAYQVEAVPAHDLTASLTPEEIARQIEADIPIDIDEPTD